MKIVVLGAGVIGTTSAWYLAQAGHEVTVLERRPAAGLETSFANGGQISAGHAEPWAKPAALSKILRWLGREDAPLLFRPRADLAQWLWGLRFIAECRPGRFERNCRALAGLAAYSRDCLRRLREKTAIQYEQLTRGILHFATSQRDLDALARQAETARPLGIRRELKSASECLALEPALQFSQERVTGGIFTPEDESGDAHRFTQELAALAAQRGVRFAMDTSVIALHVAQGEIQAIDTSKGRIGADAYVVAMGSYSAPLLRSVGLRIPVYPLKGYSITLPLGPAEEAAAPTVSLTDEAFKMVISRLGTRLRAAGTAELAGYDTSMNEVRCAAIVRRVRQLFPQLGAATTVERWTGLRPATPNNVPIIGASRLRRLYLNTGHGTLGWTLACGSAAALADLLSGRRPEVEFGFAH
ncbi:MAG TPA: D-amino acid dehydrogenase [Burkholderiales bacterium]|nr:D-amino acid dehydrogenase [Burkholderiales bacterium]